MPNAPPIPSEMISGPDLGGGYLHQLSIDRDGATSTFTHHAQEGGQDAAGPPVGALDILGFVHPPTPCMFGGPRCWHRRYLLPFAATPRVRFAYQRHRLVLDTMLRQAHGLVPVAIDDALREVLRRVSDPLHAEGIEWYLGGSAAVALLGGGGLPRDLDLGTTRDGVDRLGELLAEYMVEPVAPTDWPPDRIVRAGRAFVGTPRAGARVEWAVPLDRTGPLHWAEFVSEPGVTRTVTVNGPEGQPVRVSRPEYGLVRAAVLGRSLAVEAALSAVRSAGVDAELLDVLLHRSGLPDSAQASVRRRAGRPA